MKEDLFYPGTVDLNKAYTFEEFEKLYREFYKYTRRSNQKVLVFEWHEYNRARLKKIIGNPNNGEIKNGYIN